MVLTLCSWGWAPTKFVYTCWDTPHDNVNRDHRCQQGFYSRELSCLYKLCKSIQKIFHSWAKGPPTHSTILPSLDLKHEKWCVKLSVFIQNHDLSLTINKILVVPALNDMHLLHWKMCSEHNPCSNNFTFENHIWKKKNKKQYNVLTSWRQGFNLLPS